MGKKQLGSVLQERGKITAEELDSVLAEQQNRNVRLGELLLERGLVSKADIASAVEEINLAPYVECPPEKVDPTALALIPPEVALRCCALPLSCVEKKLVVALAEPQNLHLLEELRLIAGREISPRFSFRDDVLEGIKLFYGKKEAARTTPTKERQEEGLSLVRDAESSDIQFFPASSRERGREATKELEDWLQKRTPAVPIVSSLLIAAATKNASDIHIEPHPTGGTVRLRVDGVLRDLTTVPAPHLAAVISRIKILAGMDIIVGGVPQDGRFQIQYCDRKLDLRVSILPTRFGEKVLLRLLDSTAIQGGLEGLGLDKAHAQRLHQILSLPQGVLIVTGPAGSGKSTTLYSALNLLRPQGRYILTVEDPIEYMLDGINQAQVNPRSGETFANCLRSVLRQAPDIILVGEVRDKETAEIGLEAAQTGHLVLSTMHTNDSVSAIARLLDLGVSAPLVASSVTAIVAQRLVRRLCECRQPMPLTPEYTDRLFSLGLREISDSLFQAAGCPACDMTGYKGRIGVFELLLFDGPVREAVHAGAPPEAIRQLGRASGFKSMQESALEKVQQGLTTLEEVLRVVPCETVSRLRCEVCSREVMPTFRYCPFCGTLRGGVLTVGPQATAPAEREVS